MPNHCAVKFPGWAMLKVWLSTLNTPLGGAVSCPNKVPLAEVKSRLRLDNCEGRAILANETVSSPGEVKLNESLSVCVPCKIPTLVYSTSSARAWAAPIVQHAIAPATTKHLPLIFI